MQLVDNTKATLMLLYNNQISSLADNTMQPKAPRVVAKDFGQQNGANNVDIQTNLSTPGAIRVTLSFHTPAKVEIPQFINKVLV